LGRHHGSYYLREVGGVWALDRDLRGEDTLCRRLLPWPFGFPRVLLRGIVLIHDDFYDIDDFDLLVYEWVSGGLGDLFELLDNGLPTIINLNHLPTVQFRLRTLDHLLGGLDGSRLPNRELSVF